MELPSSTHRLTGKEPHIISLMLLSAFAIMGAILMTPGLPVIAAYFNISIGLTQLTVTSFLLGYALGQLIYGPIANRFGRKQAFYVGITVATLGSIFSILASPIESFHLLILGRLLEALGSSVGVVVCITIINDFYYPEQARKVMGLLMFAFAIVPGVAIALGGILTQYFGWQSCFYFLLFYGLFLLYPALRLPETVGKRDPNALRYHYVLKNYGKILTNKKLIGYSLCSGFSSACIYVFGAEGPFIGVHLLKIPPATYGLWGLTPFIGTLLGSIITIRLTHVNATIILKIAFLLELVATIVMFLFFSLHLVSLATLLIPMALLCMGHPILSSTAITLAMAETNDRANGSAVINFVGMSMPVIMTFLLSMLHVSSAWIMPSIFFISLTLMLSSYLMLLRDKPC